MARRGNGEGSIYQRKSDGKWVGSVTLENRKRKVFYGNTRREVQEKMKVALREQQQGTLITAPQQTLKAYLEYWLEDVHKPNIRISTYVKYKKLLKYILPTLGQTMLQKLTPQQIQKLYANKLKEGLSPKMVVCIHGLLHKALDNAVKWGLVARNVCDLVSPPRLRKKEKQVLSLEQAHTLLMHVKKHRLEAILMLALTTGMRRGEILALHWQDINLQEGSVQVKRTVDYIPHYGYVETEPKTATGFRKIMLPTFVVGALKAHHVQQDEARSKSGDKWVEKDLIFCGLLGDYFNPNYLLRVFKQVLIDAGLPHMRFHDLRHSAATILLSMNVHPKVVQEVLGHSTISMTLDIYSHVLPSMQRDVPDHWDDEFGE